MPKVPALLLLFLCGLILAACTVAVQQPGGPTAALPEAAPPGQAAANTQPASLPWANLNLSGSLILIRPGQSGFAIYRFDLQTGTSDLLFQAPEGALLSTALASPDGARLLLTYAPPATAENQVAYTSLYLLNADGSGTPQPVFKTPHPGEAFFAPSWSPDGKAIYTSHFIRGTGESSPDRFTLDRVTLDGQLQTLLPDAIWPRLSPDGAQISYVSAHPGSTDNELYLANADGTDPRLVLVPGAFPAVDDHFFAPDGKSIVFSAVNNPQPTPVPTFWDRLFGVRIVSAHTVPSDWYRIELDSGRVSRLTNLEDIGMYASLSPEGQRMAFIAQTGVYVMNLDGSQLTQLSNQAATGTVDWVR